MCQINNQPRVQFYYSEILRLHKRNLVLIFICWKTFNRSDESKADFSTWHQCIESITMAWTEVSLSNYNSFKHFRVKKVFGLVANKIVSDFWTWIPIGWNDVCSFNGLFKCTACLNIKFPLITFISPLKAEQLPKNRDKMHFNDWNWLKFNRVFDHWCTIKCNKPPTVRTFN